MTDASPPQQPDPPDDFEEMLAGYDRIIHDKELQQQLLDAGLLVRVDPVAVEPPLPVDPERDGGEGTVWHYCDFDSPHHVAALAVPLPVDPPALDRVAFAAAIQEVGLPMQYVHRIMDRYAAALSGTEPGE